MKKFIKQFFEQLKLQITNLYGSHVFWLLDFFFSHNQRKEKDNKFPQK